MLFLIRAAGGPALQEEMQLAEGAEDDEPHVNYPQVVVDFKRWITSKSTNIESESNKMTNANFTSMLKSHCPGRPAIGLEISMCSLWQLRHSASILVGWRSVTLPCLSESSFCSLTHSCLTDSQWNEAMSQVTATSLIVSVSFLIGMMSMSV